MKTSAERVSRLAPYFFAAAGRKISELQAAGKDVIRLDVGSPDLPPAGHILAALAESAARPDSHGYQPHHGPLRLREAWAERYRLDHRVELDPETEVVPLLGSKEGIFHLISACVDPGDVVLIPDPGYLTYTQAVRYAGGEPYYLTLEPDRGYLPDLGAVPPEILRRAGMLWLNYPNNPTASAAPEAFFDEAVAFARRHDLLLCHDAAYVQVTFKGYRAPSLLEIAGAKDVAVEFNSLSKAYNMPGWRVGAAVGNPRALRSLLALKTHADSGHFLPVMEAAVAALCGDQSWVAERNEVYRVRRDAVVERLRSLGLAVQRPEASLYVWSPVPAGWTSAEFASALLETAHVSLTPGTVFGGNGEGFVRISLTSPVERLKEAMQRLEAALPGLRRPK